jgi:hypothetical protein
MKHETSLNFEMISTGKHKVLQHHANFTVLEALLCTGRIAERTASCYMLLLQESILLGPELLSRRFFYIIIVLFSLFLFLFLSPTHQMRGESNCSRSHVQGTYYMR